MSGADVASIIRQTAVWTGAPGLPGYTQLYHEASGDPATQAQEAHNAVRGMFNEIVTLIPADITVTVSPVYQVLDEVTGEVTGEETVGTPSAAVAGGYVGNWAGQVGVLVEWTTGTYVNGHSLRGRTYLVPLGNVSDDDGTLPAGTITTVGAGAAWISSSGAQFGVWHRPVNDAGGHLVSISGYVVRDHAAILRSRRV
jgi:hypothetical protein